MTIYVQLTVTRGAFVIKSFLRKAHFFKVYIPSFSPEFERDVRWISKLISGTLLVFAILSINSSASRFLPLLSNQRTDSGTNGQENRTRLKNIVRLLEAF